MDTWNQNLNTDVYDISNSTFSQTESIPWRHDTGAVVYHTHVCHVTVPTFACVDTASQVFGYLGASDGIKTESVSRPGLYRFKQKHTVMKPNEGQFWNCLDFHSFYIHLSLNLQTYRGLILVYDFYLFKRLHRFKIFAQVCPLGSYLILLGFKSA